MTSSPFGSVVALDAFLELGSLRASGDRRAEQRASSARANRAKSHSVSAVASRTRPWFLSRSSMSNSTPRTHSKRLAARVATRSASRPRMSRSRPYTTFKIGGPADLFFEATSADELANAVLAAREPVYRTSCSGSAPTSSSATRASAGSSSETPRAHHEFRERRRRLPSVDGERRDRSRI